VRAGEKLLLARERARNLDNLIVLIKEAGGFYSPTLMSFFG
jgi:hypothetical protein